VLSPIVFVAIPLIAERMLNSEFPNWWVLAFQYNAYLAIPLVCAAVDGAARLDRWAVAIWRSFAPRRAVPSAAAEGEPDLAELTGATIPAQPTSAAEGVATAAVPSAPVTSRAAGGQFPRGIVALVCSVAVCGVVLYMVPRFELDPMLHRWFYQQTAASKAQAAAAAVVPSGTVVEATNNIGPNISARDTVLLWDGDGKTPPFAAPWAIVQLRVHEFTFSSMTEQRDSVNNLLDHGYKVVFRRDGYLVLHRPGKANLSEPNGEAPQGAAPQGDSG
jgi:hypothetical protein